MRVNLLTIIFSLIIIKVHLNLRPEKRQELLDKLTTKISITDTEQNLDKFVDFGEGSFKKISYDIDEIKSLMKQYDLPESYNYFNDTGAEIIVKNQESCGCCWSFASSSALAYRFKKFGIDINLSAQNPVSCYKRDCKGNYNIDAHLNLVKNGTVTDGCFPFKSADGITIPECPNQCEDGSDYKKYYSQNAYLADVNEKVFKEVVILAMDQLVTQGPIMGSFDVYEDFDAFGTDKEKCKNDVYSYDGISANGGAHAITIVGYGILKNKIYWLLQNSWGDNWCDNGFIKMEIGHFYGITFSEPNIQPEIVNPVQIQVNFWNLDDYCKLTVNTSSSLDEWKNTLDVNFYSEETSQNIHFQIGRNKIKGENQINSFYEIGKIYYGTKKGVYKFKGFESLGTENTFKLNYFQGKQFGYYGYDDFAPVTKEVYYISQVGNKFIFNVGFVSNDETLPALYLKSSYYFFLLENCDLIKTSTKLDYYLGYCEINYKTLNFLESCSQQTCLFDFANLCGKIYYSGLKITKLDTRNYPVFKVIQFIKPNDTEISKETDLILVSKVAGGTKYFKNENGTFFAIMEIENANEQNVTKNTTVSVLCAANVNFNYIEANLTCHLYDNNRVYQYQNIYLLSYGYPDKYALQFEVFIPTTIKAGDDPINPDPSPVPVGTSSNLEYSLILLFCLLLSLL